MSSEPSHSDRLPVRLKRALFGAPRDLGDRRIFHQLALIPLLAWIGLGADALSSTAYGPELASKHLGMAHEYLTLPIALAISATVILLSFAYSALIEAFPTGGGYGVASRMLGRRVGVLAGSALIIDYVLTIAISTVAGAEAFLSLLAIDKTHIDTYTMWGAIGTVIVLCGLNLRGVKESIVILAPIFLIFVLSYAILLIVGIGSHAGQITTVHERVVDGFSHDWSTIGAAGIAIAFMTAYSVGGATCTGLEAVSNSLNMMREPKVANGKRTLVYIAISLSLMSAGLILCYQLWNIHPTEGKTMNALLAEAITSGWGWAGTALVWGAMVATALLLVAAAQAGFIAGPRVVANMAIDGFAPRAFSALSERLTMGRAMLLLGLAAIITIYCTKAKIEILGVIYSLSVFLTFALSMAGMLRYWWREKRGSPGRARKVVLYVTSLTLCVGVFAAMLISEFGNGGLYALIALACVSALAFLIHAHYNTVSQGLTKLYLSLEGLPRHDGPPLPAPDTKHPVAVIMVSHYGGIGIHTVLNALRAFPGFFKGLVFVSVGVIDSGRFKGEDSIQRQREETEASLRRYVELANGMGLPATAMQSIGIDAVDEAEDLCNQVAEQYPKSTFFAGKLIFRRETWYSRLLHNDAAMAVQRRLQLSGKSVVVIPARIG